MSIFERRTPPRMEVLRRGLSAIEATTQAFNLRNEGKYAHVLTAWDRESDTWKVCVRK